MLEGRSFLSTLGVWLGVTNIFWIIIIIIIIIITIIVIVSLSLHNAGNVTEYRVTLLVA